jgi:hypothetical protein
MRESSKGGGMRYLVPILMISMLLPLLNASAQSQWTIVRSVIGTGGEPMSNVDYVVHGTAGQSAIGGMSGVESDVYGGFWYLPGDPTTGVDFPAGEIPEQFALSNGRPNPARSVMTVAYAVPQRSRVSVSLFDVSGRLVRRLTEGDQDPGYHRVAIDASGLACGIYFCRMEAPGFSATRRLVLLR